MSNMKLESAQSFMKSADNQGFARGFSSSLALRATSLLSVLASVYGAQGYEPTVIDSKTIRVYDNLTKNFADYTMRTNGDVEAVVIKAGTSVWREKYPAHWFKYGTTLHSMLIPSGAVLMIDLTDDLKALQDNNYQSLDQPKADPAVASALAILAVGELLGEITNSTFGPSSMRSKRSADDFEKFINGLTNLG